MPPYQFDTAIPRSSRARRTPASPAENHAVCHPAPLSVLPRVEVRQNRPDSSLRSTVRHEASVPLSAQGLLGPIEGCVALKERVPCIVYGVLVTYGAGISAGYVEAFR